MTMDSKRTPSETPIAISDEGCQPAEEPRRAWWRTLTESSQVGLVIVLVLLFLVFSLASPNFLTARNMVILAGSIAMIGIVAGAMTLVIIGGNLDLSVAGNIAITSVIVAKFLVDFQASEGVSILAGLLTGLTIGVANGLLVAGLGINSVIATLATYNITRWGAHIIARTGKVHGQSISIAYTEQRAFFNFIGQGDVAGIPSPFILMVLILLSIGLFLNRTRFGREFFAVGGNPLAARMTGISVRRYTFFAFALTGLVAGISGIIFCSRLAGGYALGAAGWELDIVTAVFLGGTSLAGGQGSILGTFLGVLIIGTLRNGMALAGIDIAAQNIATGSVLLLAVLYDRLRHGGTTD
jgi:ribose/xylose/arabinose/galactoside ABC-type transport system permease subunit